VVRSFAAHLLVTRGTHARCVTGPLVIGHRGASGHRPEHTSLAYRHAWRGGADSVEPDVVITRDGVLVCRHDLDLARTTDVARRPEFADRRRRLVVAGREHHGWFVQDFDLAEVRQLRARERWPSSRTGSARYDGLLGVLTLEELLDLREAESQRAGRRLGVHIELKHPELFADLGMPLDEPLVDLLRRRRLTSALSGAAVMSFDPHVLRRLRREVDTELVQLVDRVEPVKRRRLQRVATYATAVGLHKNHARERSIATAFACGLDVLVWTLREETPVDIGRLFDLGVDGVLTDFPELAVGVRDQRAGASVASAS
jgi:glycerophosphoryl diester phosphodiesterase